MDKNMYSLMLSPQVVSVIDRLAAAAGTSRSQMVNSILAEYISYRTPEMRLQDMFDQMEALLRRQSDGLKIMLRSSDSMLSLRSALTYKYNPTVHYSVELYRVMSGSVGEMRAQLRTQNSSLLLYVSQFFKLWGRLESSGPGSGEYAIAPGRYTRKFMLPEAEGPVDEEELSQAIVDYINAFDSALKAFFYHLDQPQQAVAQVEQLWRQYVSSAKRLL